MVLGQAKQSARHLFLPTRTILQQCGSKLNPVEPDWLIQVLGVPRLELELSHQGPLPLRGGNIEIRTVVPSSQGELTRAMVVDSRGLVLEQHLYSPRGDRLASALMSKHAREVNSGVILPGRIEMQWPTTQFSMALEVSQWQVNPAGGLSSELWNLPQSEYPGFPLVDLADPNLPAGYIAPPPNAAAPPIPAATRPRNLWDSLRR